MLFLGSLLCKEGGVMAVDASKVVAMVGLYDRGF